MSGPIPGKDLHVVDIEAVGVEVAPEVLGRPGAPPIAYARIRGLPQMVLKAPIFLNRPKYANVFPDGPVNRYTPMVCSVQACFLAGPFGLVCFPDGTLLRQSVLRLEPTILRYALEHMKEAFPGRQGVWT